MVAMIIYIITSAAFASFILGSKEVRVRVVASSSPEALAKLTAYGEVTVLLSCKKRVK
jgi:hypothetical protein